MRIVVLGGWEGVFFSFVVDNSGPRDSHFALSEGQLQCSFGCAIVDPSHDS